MEFKREDFIKIRTFQDKFFYGLRPNFFDNMESTEELEEEEKEPELTPEELAEIEKKKLLEEKKAKLKAELAALEDVVEEIAKEGE